MKSIATLVASILLLSPAAALAERGPGHDGLGGLIPRIEARGHAEIESDNEIEAHTPGMHFGDDRDASSTNRGGPGNFKLGPAIHNLASTTRAEWKAMGSTTREALRAKLDAIHDLIAEHKGDMRERAEAAKEKAKERFGDRVEKFVGNIGGRLASTSDKFSDIAGRAGTRIDELQAQGFDMSASAQLLVTAQADIATANDKIADVGKALDDAMGTTTPKAQIPQVRAAVKAAEDALKLAKDDLLKALHSIKVEGQATTTVSH